MRTGRGKVVVVSGPSGVGKSTIVREVQARTGALFSVSATTRPRRPDERDGRDYRFLDRGKFQDLLRRGQFLEWAEVFGELYGTPAGPVQEAIRESRTIILDIDVQGALQVRRKMPEAVLVLVVPPSTAVLADRLQGRGTEDSEKLRRRLAQAEAEIAAALNSGVYNHSVVNDDLESAVRQVVAIVNEEPSTR